MRSLLDRVIPAARRACPWRRATCTVAPAAIAVLASWILTCPGVVRPAHAITPGFVQRFQAAGTAGFVSGSVLSNPGSEGADGTGDGYLRVATSPPVNNFLGAFNADPAYAGNLVAAGVTKLRMKVRDVGAPQATELHITVGNAFNRWQYNVGVVPGADWTVYEADLADSTQWTAVVTTIPGSFTQAKLTHDRFHFRHDFAPYTLTPDSVAAEVGIDDVEIVTAATAAPGRAPQLAAPRVEVSPNPFNPATTVRFELQDPADVRLEAFDAAGRRVRRLVVASLRAGAHRVEWDGRDDAGTPVGSGTYLLRLQADALVVKAKAVLVQ